MFAGRTPRQLALHGGTLRTKPLLTQIEAAYQAGFTGLSIWMSHFSDYLQAGGSVEQLLTALRTRGLEVIEIDAIRGWVSTTGSAFSKTLAVASRMLAAAEELDCKIVCATTLGDSPLDIDRTTRNYRALCDLAAGTGIRIALEFLPWTVVPDITSARRIVEAADASNGGLLIDAFHFFCGSSTFADLEEVPADQILLVHLNDLSDPSALDGDLPTLTRSQRRIPSDGVFPLGAFVQALATKGYDGYYCLEVLNDTLDREAPDCVAQRCMDATRDLLGI